MVVAFNGASDMGGRLLKFFSHDARGIKKLWLPIVQEAASAGRRYFSNLLML